MPLMMYELKERIGKKSKLNKGGTSEERIDQDRRKQD
jgi:hypothetical protein